MKNETARLKIHFSDVFNVSAEVIENYGAFNVSLINDLPLFIDPFLLFNSRKQAYQELHDEIIRYLRFLRDLVEEGGVSEGVLRELFMFPEVRQNWLGFSLVGNSGSGLGIDFARSLKENLVTIVSNFGEEKVTKGSHLEKLCLIKDGVGRDNISDFTTNLIKGFLLQYTERFAKDHLVKDQRRKRRVRRSRFDYRTRTWVADSYELPWYEDDYVILTPKDLLTRDENWINKSDLLHDFDDVVVALPDQVLRSQVDQYLVRMLPKAPSRKEISAAVLRALRKFPALIDFYILYKEESGDKAVALSGKRVQDVEQLFVRQLSEFVTELHLETDFYATPADTLSEARARVLFLKDVIENKGGHRLFYIKGKPVRRESDLHILFRLTWFATPADVSREVDDGRGPVDFKISRGSLDKTLVEFKLAKNTQLKRNLKNQTEIYQRASDAEAALKVIIYFSESEHRRVLRILKDLGLEGSRNIVLIDGSNQNKPSGSRA